MIGGRLRRGAGLRFLLAAGTAGYYAAAVFSSSTSFDSTAFASP